MRKSKEIEDVIREEYAELNETVDMVANTLALSEKLMSRVNARLGVEEFTNAQEFGAYVKNIGRRGSAKGGLPKLRGGHGPGKGKKCGY